MPHLLHRPRLPLLLAVLGATAALLGPVSTATGSPHTGAAPAALLPAAGSVTLDAWGGLHPSAGVPLDATGAPYWRGWDIARSLQLLPAGRGGWVLDGWGGIHPFGSAPALPAGPYWQNWDIARDLVALPDGSGGWVLDGWGGIHPFGSAPALPTGPYWQNWDIARGLAVHYSLLGRPDGGWVLDGWGGVHAFGAAPALASTHAVPGVDVWLHLHPVAGGAYLAGRWGLVDSTGRPAGIGFDGMPDWGGWDIVRDVVPVAPGLALGAQPFRPGAAAALMAALQSRDRIDRGRAAVGEDGALDAVSGGSGGYDLAGCGGPAVTIPSRSLDLLQRDYFSHSVAGCAQGQQVFTTYLASLSWHSAGENIAWSSGTASMVDDIVQINGLWLNSPDHLANIVNPAFTRVGCGAAFTSAGHYQGATGPLFVWTCIFTG
jgi:hypothetical protein